MKPFMLIFQVLIFSFQTINFTSTVHQEIFPLSPFLRSQGRGRGALSLHILSYKVQQVSDCEGHVLSTY